MKETGQTAQRKERSLSGFLAEKGKISLILLMV